MTILDSKYLNVNGIIGKKIGMTSVFGKLRIPLRHSKAILIKQEQLLKER